MILWITALYNQLQHKESGPRWLKCFLDLKHDQGQQIVRLLVENEKYHILFFALEDPQHCAYVMPMQTSAAQRSQLLEWLLTGQTWTASGKSSLSKDALKAEFDRIKPKLTEELQNQDRRTPVVSD
jgi:serine/threonine-protein kinase